MTLEIAALVNSQFVHNGGCDAGGIPAAASEAILAILALIAILVDRHIRTQRPA